MISQDRLRAAIKAALIHLAVSFAVAAIFAVLIFGLWYPPPFDQLAKGRELLFLIFIVDVICGPLLTLVVFDQKKSRSELWRDMGLIGLIQILALIYGIVSLMNARPVWVAFEGDRFRVVSVPDIDLSQVHLAPESLRKLSLTGPRLLGVRLVSGSDSEFKDSIFLSLNGEPPAFRPTRWVPYESQIQTVLSSSKPISELIRKYPAEQGAINKISREVSLPIDQLGFMPLVGADTLEWTAVISLRDGYPISYLALDAWD